ncbi:iron ABC transporter permease [Sphingomonas donggukensis]|uniref:Iron ABC transporter permease n=1 Tax=Sphingomonas donggukensis TaxID=2949093 RepID=A0ABY4TXT4_9SPHN|nr:iron ABC transporter permease [Sphingomonas donggukensis]URW76690.1 iron ABC transporter permease [Sphingomonas donggukensis]
MRLTLFLVVASIVAIVAACFLGSVPLPPARLLAALLGGGTPEDRIVVWLIRLPRAVAAFTAGAALGLSGAALQGLLRNPLAEPGVLGVSACATLAATTTLYYGLAGASAFALPFASIVGALAGTALIAAVALRTLSVTTLILIGVGLSSFAGAIMALLLNLAPNPFSLADMINWTLGSVANRSFAEIGAALPFIGGGAAILLATRRGLSALTLGEEAAAGVGLDLKRQRIAVVLGAGLATGGSIALAGAIGFVGIVAPHLVRPWVGYDPARSLVPSALAAGLFVTVADIGVRVIPSVNELRLGVVAAIVGAPLFILIAVRRRGA